MPAALASRDEIIDRLFTVFRERGFEGASLSDLSSATGLGKSSLYHYFPQGKEQMAEAVLARAQQQIDSVILEVAQSSDSLKARVRKIAATLDAFYAGGKKSCVLGQLSGSAIGTGARHNLRAAFADWMSGIARLAAESGMSPARARNFAEDWIACLQGSLILHSATGSTAPFERALAALLDLAKPRATREAK